MKIYNKYIVLAAMALTFAACTQEDDFTPQTDNDAVKINATIGKLQTRVAYEDDGATNFINGDEICVQNILRETKNIATYTFDGTTWTTTDAFVWNGSAKNQFKAWYPAATASFDSFDLPTDQSAGIDKADWMTAETEEMTKPGSGVLDLNFVHKLTKVTVTVSFNSQYPAGDNYVSMFRFFTNEETPVEVTPYESKDGYTAILLPGVYAEEASFITLEMNFEDNLTVPVNNTLIAGLEAGKHYNFHLTVGKDAVGISYIRVLDWDEEEIAGGMAEEVKLPAVIDGNTTAETLQYTISEKLVAGHTDIRITLAEDADATMFSAITAALAADDIAEGSIDLTISGVKTVPDEGFIDMNDYFDNGEINIAGDKLKSLTLTDVETIGEYAFSACTYLESVNMPQVVTIGECAFNEWKKGTKLTSLNLPNATTIGDWAFAYSSLLTSINLPKVTSIGMHAFGYCDLRTLNLPEVTTIDGEAFLNNYNLVYCSAPKATTIGYYPWGNCSKLETLELTAAGDFTLSNNLFANTPTGQINLVLNKDKESQVTQNGDGTATWKTTNSNGGKLEYTFKSITFVGE